jgi:hypothetical protein
VQQIAKHFAVRLNKILDDLGMPIPPRDRALTLSKMLDIPKHQAWGLIDGHIVPDQDLLERIAIELDVDPQMLMDDKKK